VCEKEYAKDERVARKEIKPFMKSHDLRKREEEDGCKSRKKEIISAQVH
jgi:hypothetical protein